MKKGKTIQWIYKLAEQVLLLLPDWITGKSSVLHQKYRKKYGLKDCDSLIKQQKIKIMIAYILIIAIFILLFCSSTILQFIEKREITKIQRPDYGEKIISVPVEIQVEYQGYKVRKDVDLKVQESSLSEKETNKILQVFSNQLDQLILGENIDIKHISKRLNLMERDQDTGITIQWTSDQPEVLNEKGEIYLLKAEDHQRVRLQAELTLGEMTRIKKIELNIEKNASKDDYIQNIGQSINRTIDQLSESSSSKYLQLPNELESGIKVRWFNRSNNNSILFLFFILSVLIVYFNRYDRINKEIKESEESIIMDLPEFMNKIVLLLNAGLVVSSAISKIVKDYETFNLDMQSKKDVRRKRYLYEELCKIQKKVNQSNTSLIKELKEFSQRSGVRELVRIVAVISDNWDKGSTMMDKLEGESELLWIIRKKRAEERGRLAETKLTFPLMILLIVLIMVTIAPALMEM